MTAADTAPMIIGVGHLSYGDDVAGLLVVWHLWQLGVSALEHSGDAFSLTCKWREASNVVVIDSVVTGAEPGTIVLWDSQTQPFEADGFRARTYDFGLADVLEFGRLLGSLPPRLLLYGIEGRRFQEGTGPSSQVAEAAERLAHQLAKEFRSRLGIPKLGCG